MNKVYIPQKLMVGFQPRKDTYTTRLGYVIYFDDDGTLRKKTSWDGWRSEDVEPETHDNLPTVGFVLNKSVGGRKGYYRWDARQQKCRVYDPRDWEFEITIPNLLFILEHATNTKGKGLEGEFVYGWEGSELVLIPVAAPSYSDWLRSSEERFNKTIFTKKDMVPGRTYRDKDGDDLVYLDHSWRYVDWGWSSKRGKKYSSRYYYFYNLRTKKIEFHASLRKTLVFCVDDNVHPEYANYRDILEHMEAYSPIDPSKNQYIPVTLEQLQHFNKGEGNGWFTVYEDGAEEKIFRRYGPEKDRLKMYSRWNEIELTPEELLEAHPNITIKVEYLQNGRRKK